MWVVIHWKFGFKSCCVMLHPRDSDCLWLECQLTRISFLGTWQHEGKYTLNFQIFRSLSENLNEQQICGFCWSAVQHWCLLSSKVLLKVLVHIMWDGCTPIHPRHLDAHVGNVGGWIYTCCRLFVLWTSACGLHTKQTSSSNFELNMAAKSFLFSLGVLKPRVKWPCMILYVWWYMMIFIYYFKVPVVWYDYLIF